MEVCCYFEYVTQTIGSDRFGKLRLPEGHNTGDTPYNYLKGLWPVMLPVVESYCPAPQWPILFGLAIQEGIILGKSNIDPLLALSIVMESAIAMSIPNGVTSIGECAFGGCAKLTTITIPSSVTSIGISAFVGTNIPAPILINNGKTLCYVPGTYKSYTVPDTVTAINDGAFCKWVGRNTALVNAVKTEMDVSPQILNGRTMVPLRFVTESLGCEVLWDKNIQSITINY